MRCYGRRERGEISMADEHLANEIAMRVLALQREARHRPDVICLSATMPALSVRVLESIQQVQAAYPTAQFVIGGRGLSSQLRSLSGSGSATACPRSWRPWTPRSSARS
jgi:hypothetical protein